MATELKVGMITAEPVINNFGQTLLPKGLELSARHIDMLRVWNIQAVQIKSEQKDESLEISEELRSHATELFLKRISWEPRNPIEEDIIDLGVLATANMLMKRGEANA